MRLIVHLTEHQSSEDQSAASIDISLPDGSRYDTLQEHFDRLLSIVYGYPIGKADSNYKNPLDPEDE
jgi:hypothetical protein